MSTYRSIDYARVGWDLARIFDEMSDALNKKFLTGLLRDRENLLEHQTG
jgi:hypothetical protein